MRALLLLLVTVPAVGTAQQAPPCTKALTGVLFDFGTREAPRLFKCDGAAWSLWTPPAALCPASTPAPAPPTPTVVPPAPAQPGPPPPAPSLDELPPLPTGPAPGATQSPGASPECRRQCTAAFTRCVQTRCGTALAASCRQDCDRNQTKCVTGCP